MLMKVSLTIPFSWFQTQFILRRSQIQHSLTSKQFFYMLTFDTNYKVDDIRLVGEGHRRWRGKYESAAREYV